MENIEDKPLSVEQARNYIHHKDFDKSAKKQIKDMLETPLAPTEANASVSVRALRMGLATLKNEGKEGIFKKLLACRARGATYTQLSLVMKLPEDKIKIVERNAMKCVKERLHAQKIIPVVN